MRFLLCIFALLLAQTYGWVSPAHSRRMPSLAMVETLTLEGITDHEETGAELKESVRKWLDFEWMEQSIHAEIGEVCKCTYIQARNQGEAEVMSIMMQVADDLSETWDKFYDEAFVGPYDVANYVSDFLTAKTGIEGCDCNARIH